ncbi:rRNA maturation RNase YbeY [Tindallia californiensis]|uniref:Endoribonuclease YbeY n=1 Tax=Tindallia californiensis TaxID=159292 RepID=A0A1H3ISG1_9FIRM|nr:rRNA maturation RNase YbeY [Tindallia californiensis]SDY30621.1 probable rRNA maturation factor [Tindallia californiensis]
MTILIDIDNRQDVFDVTEEEIKLIEKAVAYCYEVEEYSCEYQLSISFVSNQEIHDLNLHYRQKDEATDVLSFPMDFQGPELEEKLLGDIVISADKMMEQAIEYGHSVKREMIYLIIHSVFHLMGYDHMIDSDKQIMRQQEKKVMSLMNLSSD